MKTTKYTNKELVEIYKNLKTSAKILGFASASDCGMMVAIELEAVKRHLNLIDGTVEETAETETAKPETAETDDSTNFIQRTESNSKVRNLEVCKQEKRKYRQRRQQDVYESSGIFQ